MKNNKQSCHHHYNVNNRHLSGFTLIELSIVLIIIGLIVGGILVGQQLIANARMQSMVSQVIKYDTVNNAFVNEYNAIPGDLGDATDYGIIGDCTDDCDGNGNGRLDDADPSGDNIADSFDGELPLFWVHLTGAELTDGSFFQSTKIEEGFPKAKSNGGIVALSVNSNLYFVVGTGDDLTDFPGNIANDTSTSSSFGITTEGAISLDRKMDDGNPLTGKAKVVNQISAKEVINPNPNVLPEEAESNITDCVVYPYGTIDNDKLPRNAIYHLANTNNVCTLMIRASY